MEIKRVLLNKKIIAVFFLIVVVTIVFFVNNEYRESEAIGVDFSIANTKRVSLLNGVRNNDINSALLYVNKQAEKNSAISSLMFYEQEKKNNYDNYIEFWQEQEKLLRREQPKLSSDYDTNKGGYNEAEIIADEYALNEVKKQLKHIKKYPRFLSSIDEKATLLNSVSIFEGDDSFSNRNITKTAEDYKNLRDIGLSVGNDEPITSVLDFAIAHYLTLLMSIVVAFKFLEERKHGLQNLVFSTPKGRTIIAFKRCVALLITVTAINATVYGSLFFTSFMVYGGAEDLFRSVQSIEMFKNFIFPMSELQFIVLYISVNILTQLSTVFLIFFLFSLIQNNVLCCGLLGLVFGAEYLLYTFVPIQSDINLLKCLNLFYLINPTYAVIKYTNLSSSFGIVGFFDLIISSAIILISAFVLLITLYCSRKYPQKTPNRLTRFIIRIFETIKNLYWRVIERLGVVGTELYKLLVIQKGGIVLAVMIVILFGYINTSKPIYSGADSIVNRFYDNYSGVVSTEAIKYIDGLEKEIKTVDKEMKQAVNDFQLGKKTQEEYDNVILKSLAYDNEREAYGIISERLKYIDSKKDEAWLVNPTGYEKLIGEESYSRQFEFSLFSVFSLVIILSGVFSFERKAAVENSIKPCYRGREYLFVRKLLSAGIVTTIVWAVTAFVDWYCVAVKFPLDTLNAPIKSLSFMQNFPIKISIGMFLIFVCFARLILLLAISGIVCMVSSLTKYEVSIAVSFIVLILPSLLYLLGIKLFVNISFVYSVAMMNLITNSEGITFIIPILMIIVVGAMSVWLAKRRWCSI